MSTTAHVIVLLPLASCIPEVSKLMQSITQDEISWVRVLLISYTDSDLRVACLSNVKVVFWHVLERHNLQVSVSGYKVVT